MATTLDFTNDEITSAIVIGEGTLNGPSIVENTAQAGLSAGEPVAAANSTTNTVWYVYTPASQGPVSMSTSGSHSDTVLAVYTIADSHQPLSYANLEVVAASDDSFDPDDYASSFLSFNASANQAYYIQLGGYGGSSGDFALSIAGPSTVPPCYCTGTLILTTRGELPVETLAAGDDVVTASGAHRPIRWIGHRRTDCARHPQPGKVMPVRILAGAVAPGIPARDLRVSPGHAVAIGGVLVKAERLVNGATILRETVPSVTYWHVELDSHDLLLADGMAAESYVECGNRLAFENGGPVTALHPEFDALAEHAANTCLPLVTDGAALATLREGLIARAGALFSSDPAVALLADGVALEPVSVAGRRYSFRVPDGTASLRLVSRSAIAGEVLAESTDRRRLGVAVRGLMLDGVAFGSESLCEGWHARVPGRDHRWTAGNAALPLARRIDFTVIALERYPLADGAPPHRGVGALGS